MPEITSKKSDLKIGVHYAIFSVLEVNQKCCKHLTKKTVFVYVLGFIFNGVSQGKTDYHNKYIS